MLVSYISFQVLVLHSHLHVVNCGQQEKKKIFCQDEYYKKLTQLINLITKAHLMHSKTILFMLFSFFWQYIN